MTLRHVTIAVTAAMMVGLGCTSLGIQTQTFQQKEQVAVTTITSVEQATVTLLNSGAISKQDAQAIEKSRNAAITALQVARAYNQATPGSGDAKLTEAIAAVTALQAYLVTKGASK